MLAASLPFIFSERIKNDDEDLSFMNEQPKVIFEDTFTQLKFFY